MFRPPEVEFFGNFPAYFKLKDAEQVDKAFSKFGYFNSGAFIFHVLI